MSADFVFYEADGVVDALSASWAPGAVLIENGDSPRVIAIGTPADVATHPAAAGALRIKRVGHVLLPGLVNAHSHLDLTHLGPRPFDERGGFAGWLDTIRRSRMDSSDDAARGVIEGVRLSMAGGVVAIGDIAGSDHRATLENLRRSPLMGVSYLEVFGLGRHQADAAARLEQALSELKPEERGIRLGLQPHAPYSAGLELYRACCQIGERRGIPVTTHLAESSAERELIRAGAGPIQRFLERLDIWSDEVAQQFGSDRSPVEHLGPDILRGLASAVHVNDAGDADIRVLAHSGTSVVYCPRAASYFDHEKSLGTHRYREMLGAGINVALGTDSIVNLPGPQSDRLSTLDEMRFLHRRDAADARVLLAMATVNGARALSLDPGLFTFDPGPLGGLNAIDVRLTPASHSPLVRVLESDAPPELLFPTATA